jgi:4'-phosphopantetheinyl transferase
MMAGPARRRTPRNHIPESVPASCIEWRTLRGIPSLGANDIHVFRIELQTRHSEDSSSLSADELTRASRFASDVDSRRYIVARAGMRSVLARFAGVSPAALIFRYSPRGRPILAAPDTALMDFNLTHSGDVALLAISRGRVGVDVESLRRRPPDIMGIASRYFSPGELTSLSCLPPPARWRRFVTIWTSKEAVAKAVGAGLAVLREVEVGVAPAQPPQVVAAPDGARQWRLFHLESEDGMLGAVAVEREYKRLLTWKWDRRQHSLLAAPG